MYLTCRRHLMVPGCHQCGYSVTRQSFPSCWTHSPSW